MVQRALAISIMTSLGLASSFQLADVRFLGLELRHDVGETYCVHVEPFGSTTLRHIGGQDWHLGGDDDSAMKLILGHPDELYAAAMGTSPRPTVRAAAPYFPDATVADLDRRGISGEGTVAFDADFFLSRLSSASMERPLLFPHATEKMAELQGLVRAGQLMQAMATTLRCGRVDVSSNAFAEMLQRAERAENAEASIRSLQKAVDDVSPSPPLWAGAGRLIGLWPDGELAQVGGDVSEGCALAIGGKLHRVTFDAGEPMGIGFGPLALIEGRGCEVGEVDEGSAAERQGVKETMVLHQLAKPDKLGKTTPQYATLERGKSRVAQLRANPELIELTDPCRDS